MEENRCPGCMELKRSGAVCEYCGFDESKQNESHQLQIGTLLQDKYLIGRALGQGGFGITYLGWNRYLEKKVAIKEYYPTFFVERHTDRSTEIVCKTAHMEEAFTENRLRFLREAKLLAKLDEVPQIVSILDFFEANNTAYIVMEYLHGSDLRDYVRKKGGRLSPKETFSILRPVMAALVKVHEAGLVHRDISPDNIMLQRDGSVKLMDFGAARSVHNPGVEKELTQATQAIVKHGFAPMEQYSERGSIGPWTDEYALCATMYYCMTGRVPDNVHDRLEEDKDVDWNSIEGLTQTQRKILQKGISIRAKDRYRSIRELMDALFEQPKPVPPEPPKPAPTPTPAPQKPSEKGSKKVIVIIAAIVCSVLALMIIPGKGNEKKVPEETVSVAATIAPEPTHAPSPPAKEEPVEITEPVEIVPGDSVMGTVTADNLNVRAEPYSTSDILKRLAINTRIEILEQKIVDGVNWGRIAEGWVNLNYVTIDGANGVGTATTGVISATELIIRQNPVAGSASVGTYKKGDQVTILETSGTWGRTNKGWINMKYVVIDVED